MTFYLGKTPAREGAVKLKFRKYINLSTLESPTPEFGHEAMVTRPWNVLGNATAGCCVFSGGGHETMLYNQERGIVVDFTDASTLSDYSALTGYNPNDPSTDQGTDMQAAAAYRKNVGLLDANGNRHKIGAYLALTVGDIEEHCIAAWHFEAVGMGFQFPGSAMDQFNNHDIWDVVPGATIEGGHYVPIFGRRKWNFANPNFVTCTWGAEQGATDNFLTTYNDESLVYLSPEMLRLDGKSIRGFDLEQLTADLAAL